jgi:hypothetical protein
VELLWSVDDRNYIQSRSQRYPGALDIDPTWTQEVLDDDDVVELSPYPSSRVGASGFVGWSPTAGKVLVVIAYRDLDGDLHGMNAWPASGRDLATYEEGTDDGKDS